MYARRFLDDYCKTKAQAEQYVLNANDTENANKSMLNTCALRSHAIFGPGDKHLFGTTCKKSS